jgi:Phosphotransferase enzyme family
VLQRCEFLPSPTIARVPPDRRLGAALDEWTGNGREDAAVVEELAELIANGHDRWMPPVVEAILGTNDPVSVAEALTAAVAAALAVPVVAARFYEPGVGVVAGLELADGRAVVAKLHRATFIPRERLATIARLQADLVAAGVPAPAPLAGPLVLGDGWLTVEEHRDGASALGYDPDVRRGMATALHNFVDAARPHAGSGCLGTWLGEPVIDDLWPEPHDLRFDLAGTAAGAEWIDDAARDARATLMATAVPNVVGHLDWRVQNLAFAGSRVSAIYDWDSVALVPEAALVGSASVIHPVDWRLEQPDPLPTLEQLDGFVADYEAARGAPFDDDEHDVLVGGQRWVTCYGARCQHSDDLLGIFPDVDHSRGWPRLLRELLDR